MVGGKGGRGEGEALLEYVAIRTQALTSLYSRKSAKNRGTAGGSVE